MKQYKVKTQHGFSLVEVMIAVLVLAIGILAVSKLQTSLIRGGSEANQRSVAASIVHKKIDDLSRFIHLNSSNNWNTLTVDSDNLIINPNSLAFEHIHDNTGGRIKPGIVYSGSMSYSLEWSVIDYYYSDATNTPATTTVTGSPAFKHVHVIASWDSVGDDTNNVVSFDTAIYRYSPSLTTVSDSFSTGNIGPTDTIDESFDFDNGAVQLDIQDGKSLIGSEIAPDISARGLSNIVEFESLVFNTSTDAVQRRDKFKTIACVCENGSSPDQPKHLIGYVTWDNISKVIVDKTKLVSYVNEYTDVSTSGTDQQVFECNQCCDDGRSRDPVSPENNGLKVCRLKLLSGGYKLVPDWKLIGFNIIPESFTYTTTNRAIYSSYVTSLVRSAAEVESDSGADYFLNSYSTVDSSFNTYSAGLISSEGHNLTTYDKTRQLQARAIYMDEVPDGAYEGATFTTTNIPLDRIPFYEVDLTKLAGWSPDEGISLAPLYAGSELLSSGGDRRWDPGQHDDIGSDCSVADNCVTNEELIDGDESTYSRGLFNANETLAPNSTTVESQLFKRSDGWVDRAISGDLVSITTLPIGVVSP